MSDSIEIVAVPSLRQRVERLAPRVQLETTQVPPQRIPQALQAGEIDFAIGSYGVLGDDIVREHLFNDPFVLLVARSHALPQTRYVVAGESPDVEQLMAEQGLTGQVRLRVARYLAVPMILSTSNLAVWLPRSLIAPLALLGRYRASSVATLERHFSLSAVRHRRSTRDPGAQWFWEQVTQLISGVHRERGQGGGITNADSAI